MVALPTFFEIYSFGFELWAVFEDAHNLGVSLIEGEGNDAFDDATDVDGGLLFEGEVDPARSFSLNPGEVEIVSG